MLVSPFPASVLRAPSPDATCTCGHSVHCNCDCHGINCDPTGTTKDALIGVKENNKACLGSVAKINSGVLTTNCAPGMAVAGISIGGVITCVKP